MATRQDPLDGRASKEATEWLILLQEEPDDPGLRRRFDTWLGESPENAVAWAATDRTAAAIEAAPPAHAGRWRPFLEARPAPVGRETGRRKRRFGLAALAAAACIALLVLPDALLNMRSDYATGTAETRRVTLEDGSTVLLAPESAIAVAYGDRERRVEILAGEAFFEAAENRDRPFRVAAGDIRATVLGTRFDVRRGDDGAAVAVEHGTVRVDHPTASPPVSETLAAGQSVRVTWGGSVVRYSGPTDRIAGWRMGRIVAQDQPMQDVIDQLRRYYKGAIIITDGSLGDRPVTGVYNLSDPIDALRGVAHAHGATVRPITPWILLVSRS